MAKESLSKDYILELMGKFEAGEISEDDLTDEEYELLAKEYTKEIRGLKAKITFRRAELKANGFLDEEYKKPNNTESDESKIDDYYLKDNPTGTGLDLFNGLEYLATYQSYEDCVFDMIFHWSITEFDTIVNMFSYKNVSVVPPYKYRAVATELYCVTDKVSRYVFYGNSLASIFEKIEKIEKRSIRFPDHFVFGVQGIGIHLFDEDEIKYRFWIGGNEFKNVADVIKAAHDENKFIPNELLQEFSELNKVDVFISHKSQDYKLAKEVYDFLISCGISVFLSEVSLPALSNADYSAEIDKALEYAENIIVIATSKENVLSGWVQYEWTTFANEKRSGRKNGNIVTLIDENMPVTDLPILLRQFEVIPVKDFENVKNFLKFEK